MKLIEKTRTLIIGGTSGIGADIAANLEYMGRQVDRPPVDVLDVCDPTSIREFIWGNGRYHHIVYSAGVNCLMPLGKIRNDILEEIFDVNVMGFIRLLDAVSIPEFMDARRPLSIVAVVSDSATTAMRHSIAYASSKAALAHAVRCGARELAPHCRVNGVSPSIVDGTPMTTAVDATVLRQRGWTEEQAREYEMSLVPMGRRCTMTEVSRVVIDLLDGPSFMTGAVIPLTGGK